MSHAEILGWARAGALLIAVILLTPDKSWTRRIAIGFFLTIWVGLAVRA